MRPDTVDRNEPSIAERPDGLPRFIRLTELSIWSEFRHALAIESGIGGMTASTGQAFWTIVATAMGQLDSAAVAELARLDQG